MSSTVENTNSFANMGLQASTLNLESLENIVLPKPGDDGIIETLNEMGGMTLGIYPITLEFIDFAAASALPVLDAGAAYGVSTVAALKKGAQVVANDVEERHLTFIVKNETLSAEDRTRLYLKTGPLPNGVDFPLRSLGAIHLCRVMHFFLPEEVERMFEKAAKWLAPRGRLYIITMSPYHSVVKGFGDIYEERLSKGVEWPGFTRENLFALDPVVLMRLAVKYGFLVKKLEMFGQFDMDGNDYTGAVFINNNKSVT